MSASNTCNINDAKTSTRNAHNMNEIIENNKKDLNSLPSENNTTTSCECKSCCTPSSVSTPHDHADGHTSSSVASPHDQSSCCTLHVAINPHDHKCCCSSCNEGILTETAEATETAMISNPTCGCPYCDQDHSENSILQNLGKRHPFCALILSNGARLISGTVLFIAGILTQKNTTVTLIFFIASALIAGIDVMWSAFKGIFSGRLFSEHFLMTIAAVGALIIGKPAESSAVMLFYLLGSSLEERATVKTSQSIHALADLRPRIAHCIQEDGSIIDHTPCELQPGDRIRVFAGERVPLDGILESNLAQLDYSALTGESLPKLIEEDGEILAGAINGHNAVDIRVTRNEHDSAITRILDLAQRASLRKTKIETFTARFARVYTPIVVILAALLAFLPPWLIPGATLNEWGYRALSFLVISCPCALIISVPLAFISGMGNASRRGILIRGSMSLEALNDTATCVFDKTGTLTTGHFTVRRIVTANDISKEQLTYYTALAEQYAGHPIAEAIRNLRPDLLGRVPCSVEEWAGKGIRTKIDKKDVLAGNRAWLEENDVFVPDDAGETLGATLVHVALDKIWIGTFYVEDTLRATAKKAIHRLRELGVSRIVIFSGDTHDVTFETGRRLDADAAFGSMMPEDKLKHLDQERSATKGKTIFVGDGINDAPALRLADVGIAMGGLGTDAAIESADVVVMTDELNRIPDAVAIARKTMRIVRQNVVFILLIKISLLLLSAIGFSALWAAIFADTGVMALSVLNALRASRCRSISPLDQGKDQRFAKSLCDVRKTEPASF